METVTADDYTVQLALSKKQIDNFKKDHRKEIEDCQGSVALALKQFLMIEIKQRMQEHAESRINIEIPKAVVKIQNVYKDLCKKEYK